MARKKGKERKIDIRGFYRLQIVGPGKKVQPATPWMQNQITNHGMNTCLVAAPMNVSGYKQGASLVLGSGSDPASTDETLESSDSKHVKAFAQSIVNGSTAARVTAQFNTTANRTVKNIGIIDTDSSLIAGKSYTQSVLSSDQSLNATYEIQYTTS
jgi:hypothetical protein